MKYGYIYKITSPSGKIYIGKTFNKKKRIESYKSASCKGQRIIYNSLVKYGFKNHHFSIIKEGYFSEELLSRYEVYYIRVCGSFIRDNDSGMNLTKGGEGVLGMKLSKESIEKMIKTKKESPPTKKELVLWEKLRIMKTGKKLNKSKEWLENNGKSIRKPILQYDLEMNLIKEWTGAIEVEELLGISRKAISVNLRGKTKHSGGFIWKYKENERY